MDEEPLDTLDTAETHIARYGPAGRPLREAVGLLTEAPYTLDGLVARTALPRRGVERLLEILDGDLEATPRGWLIRSERRLPYQERFHWERLRRTRLPNPADERLADSPELLGQLERLVATAPRPSRSLDHVSATPETIARRALWMDGTYDLTGTRLLCVGDHDLTSLAACAVNPAVVVTVVDVDEGVLAFIDEQATANGWQVHCLYGDLRHGLPAPAADWADLVFTDPPYTPAGVGLFLRRGLEGMRARDHGRLLLAYGFGEDHPALGLKVQREIQRSHLALEAILPGFNRYYGAQAIGGAAGLYVCRPTSRTWRVLDADADADASAGPGTAEAARLYTRGPWARESSTATVDVRVANAVATLATGRDGNSSAARGLPVLAGDGWPAETAAAARIPLDRLLTRGETATRGALAVDLTSAPPPWLLRTLLAANSERMVVLVSNNHPDISNKAAQEHLTTLLRSKYTIRFHRSTPDTQHGLIEGDLRSPHDLPLEARLVRHVVDRAHGKVANTWREGLTRLSRRTSPDVAGETGTASDSGPLTKNDAREIVRDASRRPETLDARLIDLPRHQIAELLTDVTSSATRVTRHVS